MAINPIEFHGTITRAQDMTTMKHNEDQKGMVKQSNFQVKMEQQVEQQMSKVRNSDNADKKKDQTDSKEKGNGQYAGDGGRNRKKSEAISEQDRIRRKGESHFDISK